MADKNRLKGYFKNGLKPTQEEFWEWMDSYWHISDLIPLASIDGINEVLLGKADSEALANLALWVNDIEDILAQQNFIKKVEYINPNLIFTFKDQTTQEIALPVPETYGALENEGLDINDDNQFFIKDEGVTEKKLSKDLKEKIGSKQDLQVTTKEGRTTDAGLEITDPENPNNKIIIEKGTIVFKQEIGKEGDQVHVIKTFSLSNGVIDIKLKYNDVPEKSLFKAGAEGVILNELIEIKPTKLLVSDDDGNVGTKGIDDPMTSQFSYVKNYHSTFFSHSFNGAALTDYFVLQSSKKKVSNLIIRGRLVVEGAYQSFEVVGNLNSIGFTSCFYKTSKSENLIEAIGLCYYQDSLVMLWIKGTDTYKSKYTNIIFDQIVAFEGSTDLNWVDEEIYEMKASTMFESLITAKIQAQLFDNSSWIKMTLGTGYKATQYDEPQYKKEGTRVYLRGSCTGAETLSNQFANLPAGFRPKTKMYVLGESTPYAISITPVGNMLRSTITQTTIKLDGYYFDVD